MYVCVCVCVCMAQLTVFEIALSSLRDVIIAASCSSTAAPDTANISVQLRSGCRLSVKQASPSTRHPKSSCMYEHMNRREYSRHTKKHAQHARMYLRGLQHAPLDVNRRFLKEMEAKKDTHTGLQKASIYA